ncbi:MAG: SDR family NAD(P)-dependent oxidoreductase [Actinomycetales bacterium]|nr:SDR family NAD(P)-dependent oxidoreductase [Actinomycetales bacterium]
MPFNRHRVSPPPRRVLVTGGLSGLGLAFVELFVARGDRVLATDLADEAPAGSLPRGAAYRRLDVRADADWSAARVAVETDWGGLDVLVNNAGIAVGGRIDIAEMSEWEAILAVNLLGVVRGCRTFTPVFKRQGAGTIVNVASLAGVVHAPAMASYNSAKAGVVALSETLRHELAPHGVQVSVVCPAFLRTNLAASLRGADAEAEAAKDRHLAQARLTPTVVAARALAGVDAGRLLVFTDAIGRVAFWGKRLNTPLYRLAMTVPGRRLAASERRTR